MKKLFILAAAAGLFYSCAEKTDYTVKGQIDELEGQVYLFDEEGNLLDSTQVDKGAFSFKGMLTTPTLRYVADKSDLELRPTFNTQFFLEKGQIMIKNGEDKSITVSGTPANDAFAAFGKSMKALMAEYRNPETSEERRTAIEETEHDALIQNAIDQNRTNYFGVWILARMKAYGLSGQELAEQVMQFPAELQETFLVKKLKEQAEKKLRTDVGQKYIDITQPDPDGKEISLKSVIETAGNKYTLLDFWASWCGPCMGEVPFLTKAYKKYHKKGFEIYGVSFDNNRDKWLGAIKDNKMKWIHVSLLKGFDNPAAKEYSIQGIPSNFLLDAEGKIVAVNLRGEALEKKLEELLK